MEPSVALKRRVAKRERMVCILIVPWLGYIIVLLSCFLPFRKSDKENVNFLNFVASSLAFTSIYLMISQIWCNFFQKLRKYYCQDYLLKLYNVVTLVPILKIFWLNTSWNGPSPIRLVFVCSCLKEYFYYATADYYPRATSPHEPLQVDFIDTHRVLIGSAFK